MTARNILTLMLMGMAVLLFAAASDINAAGTGTGSAGSGAAGSGITGGADGADMDAGTGINQGAAGTSQGTIGQNQDMGVTSTPGDVRDQDRDRRNQGATTEQNTGTQDHDSTRGQILDQDRTEAQGKMHNIIFGWFGRDDKDEDAAKRNADQEIPTVDEDRATPEQDSTMSEQDNTMDRQQGLDKDITRDADPGASHPGASPDTMNMDRGASDLNRDVESDADSQPGATTDNLMQRVAFDSETHEQDRDAQQQDNLFEDQDQSVLDQDQQLLDQDQPALDQDQAVDQDQSVVTDPESPATSPHMTITPGGSHTGAGTADRDSMGIAR